MTKKDLSLSYLPLCSLAYTAQCARLLSPSQLRDFVPLLPSLHPQIFTRLSLLPFKTFLKYLLITTLAALFKIVVPPFPRSSHLLYPVFLFL